MTQQASISTATGIQLPWGTTDEGEFDRKGVLVGSVVGTLAVFLTFPLGILGIVLSCMGLDRIHTQPARARRLLTWSWICFVPGTLLAVAGVGWALSSLVG